MNRKWGILIYILVTAMLMTMGPGLSTGWAQPEEEEEEPIQAMPIPWDEAMQGDYFTLKDGRRAILTEGRLFIREGDRGLPAVDGNYPMAEGGAIIVSDGMIVPPDDNRPGGTRLSPTGGMASPPDDTRNLLPAVRMGTPPDDGKTLLPAVRTVPTTPMSNPLKGNTMGGSGLGNDGAKRGIVIVNGRQAVMERGADGGSRLFFLQGGKKVPAADGRYTTSDGRAITVSGGRAAFATAPVQKVIPGAKQLPAVKMR